MTHAVVFLLDVDNTLLDSDRVIEGLRGHLTRTSGRPSAARLWALFEQLRIELGYADYLGALQRDRAEVHHGAASDPVLQQRVPSRPYGRWIQSLRANIGAMQDRSAAEQAVRILQAVQVVADLAAELGVL